LKLSLKFINKNTHRYKQLKTIYCKIIYPYKINKKIKYEIL